MLFSVAWISKVEELTRPKPRLWLRRHSTLKLLIWLKMQGSKIALHENHGWRKGLQNSVAIILKFQRFSTAGSAVLLSELCYSTNWWNSKKTQRERSKFEKLAESFPHIIDDILVITILLKLPDWEWLINEQGLFFGQIEAFPRTTLRQRQISIISHFLTLCISVASLLERFNTFLRV